MPNSIVKVTTSLPAIRKQAKDFAEAAIQPNTKRAYKAAWEDFKTYCADRKIKPMPASAGDVADYITFCANGDLKTQTIAVRLAAISKAHRLNKQTDPTIDEAVKLVMKGIRRTVGTRQKQKAAITDDILSQIVGTFTDDIVGARNKAITLIGWAGAFRRGEVVSFDVEDLAFKPWGVMMLLKESKTDQEKEGVSQPVPYLEDKSICPVMALKDWLAVSGIATGPIFRRIDRWGKVGKHRLTSQVANTIVKNAVAAIGLDDDQAGFHGLRAGIITTCIRMGMSLAEIQPVSRHKKFDTLIKYQRSEGVVAMNSVLKAFSKIGKSNQ